jgi:hypothetical protein
MISVKNDKITQILSNGEIIKDFQIGDIPNSVACDYMEDCQYKCRPFQEITPERINFDTYNEEFIIFNSDKIIQKIKTLFSDKIDGKFFYKKRDLINKINVLKKYSLEQIYYALTQLIENKNEFITDRYGRNGRLINIGEYYLFQPIELKNPNISLFERMVPIDYKNDSVEFNLKNTIQESIQERKEDVEEGEMEAGKQILEEIRNLFEITKLYTKENANSPKINEEYSWYKNCGIIIRLLSKKYKEILPQPEFSEIKIEYLFKFVVYHYIDFMNDFNIKIHLLNYIQSLKTIEENTIEKYVMDYFDEKMDKNGDSTWIIFYNFNKKKTMILDNGEKWIEAEANDEYEIEQYISSKQLNTKKIYNDIIGFVGVKSNKPNVQNNWIFKTKNMNEKRNTGAECDTAGKKNQILILNSLLDNEYFNNENTKNIKGGLCVFIEILMRYFDYNNSKIVIGSREKIWFLDPDMAKTLNV